MDSVIVWDPATEFMVLKSACNRSDLSTLL